jgi:hypothetical protein
MQTEHEEKTMRKLIIGALAAVAVALGLTASNASAAWVNRTVYRWDPVYGQYVPVVEQVWVPDPVIYAPGVYADFGFRRPWYWSGYHRHYEHERHEHHEHHHHR